MDLTKNPVPILIIVLGLLVSGANVGSGGNKKMSGGILVGAIVAAYVLTLQPPAITAREKAAVQ